jgi:hypothetical protein
MTKAKKNSKDLFIIKKIGSPIRSRMTNPLTVFCGLAEMQTDHFKAEAAIF